MGGNELLRKGYSVMPSMLPTDIPELVHASDVVPVTEGWSSDCKFRVLLDDGASWMLRLSDARHRKRKRFEFECLRHAEQAGIPAPRPVAFGECDGGSRSYRLLTWVEGTDLRDVLDVASASGQRALGMKAGKLLKRLQGIPPLLPPRAWDRIFLDQVEKRKQGLAMTGIELPERDAFLTCIGRCRRALTERPMGFAHGDYHVGNLLVAPDGELAVIDFDRCRAADPWDDHKRVVWDVEASAAFASGRLDGYFGGEIPDEFWALLAAYCASNAIGSIAWALPFGAEEVAHHLRQARQLFESYDGMERIIPKWYSS